MKVLSENAPSYGGFVLGYERFCTADEQRWHMMLGVMHGSQVVIERVDVQETGGIPVGFPVEVVEEQDPDGTIHPHITRLC